MSYSDMCWTWTYLDTQTCAQQAKKKSRHIHFFQLQTGLGHEFGAKLKPNPSKHNLTSEVKKKSKRKEKDGFYNIF